MLTLKQARFSLVDNRAEVHPSNKTAESPCRLCEQLCGKTILAQRQDIQALRKELKQLKDSSQQQVRSMNAASVEAHRVMAEALKSWHGSVMALFNPSQPRDALQPPPKVSGRQPPWTHEPASATEPGREVTTDDTFDQGMFFISDSNLFDLGQLSPMVVNTDHFPSQVDPGQPKQYDGTGR